MRKKSLNSVKVKVYKLNHSEVMWKVKEYASDLVKNSKAKVVVLFGSLAKGNYSPFSDIDLLIITNKASQNPIERIHHYINPSLPLDVEPRVFTKEEFFKMAKEKRRFIKEILENGILLSGDENILLQAKNLYYDM